MKAVYFDEFGSPDVLHIREVVKPTPADNEILVKVKATSVNYGDLAARNFKNISPREFNMPGLLWLITRFAFGLNKPNIHILGSEYSGVVESVGSDVTRFKPGDDVFGYIGESMGACAEYTRVKENAAIALKPSKITFEEAAVIPYGAIMALYLLRKVNVRSGQKVLIIGASGGIGSAAVQIARSMGADVTAVCGTNRLAYVKELGANKSIDYTREDYTKSGETYDLIFDVLGRGSIRACRGLLKPGGIHLCASFKMKQLWNMLLTSRSDRRMICAIAPGSLKDLEEVRQMIEERKIKAIPARQFPMEQAAEAHRYAESGNRLGRVGMTIA
jgi:NADPH:quinone reductase-like Zn-dependent oxidoreductase